MKCPQCKLVEMVVKKVDKGNTTYVCKKCGTEIVKKNN